MSVLDDIWDSVSNTARGTNSIQGNNRNYSVYAYLARLGVPDRPGRIRLNNNKVVRVQSVRKFWAGIIKRESGGKKRAEHKNDDESIDRGLFQINSIHKQYNAQKLLDDENYNGLAARAISSGWTNAQPWSTATEAWQEADFNIDPGKGGASIGIATIGGGPSQVEQAGADAGESVAGGIKSVAEAIDSVAEAVVNFVEALFDPSTWLRIGKGLAGLILILAGISALLKMYTSQNLTDIVPGNAGAAIARKA